jgi:hypothetical protein
LKIIRDRIKPYKMEGTFRTLVDTFSCYNVCKGMSRLQQNSLIISNFKSHLFS